MWRNLLVNAFIEQNLQDRFADALAIAARDLVRLDLRERLRLLVGLFGLAGYRQFDRSLSSTERLILTTHD